MWGSIPEQHRGLLVKVGKDDYWGEANNVCHDIVVMSAITLSQ